MATITLDARAFDLTSIHKLVFGFYTGPASYVTGGEAIAAGDLKNLGEIELLIFEAAANATPIILIVRYSVSAGKALWFDLAGAQVANATDLSAYNARFIAFGK